MNPFKCAFRAEIIKLKHLWIVWLTFMAFALIPIMGGIMMFLIQHPELIPKTSILSIKTAMLTTPVNWESYLSTFIAQGAGIAGIIAFGFVAAYLFGREYSDATYRDLLALPIARSLLLNAKFLVYLIWCVGLAIADLLLGFIVGALLNLPGWEADLIWQSIKTYFITVLLTMALGTWIAFFALLTRGFLAPLGFLIVVLMFSQFAPYLGFGHYFPWSIPAIFSGAAGEIFKNRLNEWSFLTLFGTALVGYLATLGWWQYSDQA